MTTTAASAAVQRSIMPVKARWSAILKLKKRSSCSVSPEGECHMRREFPDKLVDALEEIAKLAPSRRRQYDRVENHRNVRQRRFRLPYRRLQQVHSALTQEVAATAHSLCCAGRPRPGRRNGRASDTNSSGTRRKSSDLLPRNLGVRLSCHAGDLRVRARCADDRDGQRDPNAGDMIDKLTLTYNRARQAGITKELIEIISGAEAL